MSFRHQSFASLGDAQETLAGKVPGSFEREVRQRVPIGL